MAELARMRLVVAENEKDKRLIEEKYGPKVLSIVLGLGHRSGALDDPSWLHVLITQHSDILNGIKNAVEGLPIEVANQF